MAKAAKSSRLPVGLFMLRITIFLVMLMWTLDKFIRPEHSGQVFQIFYKIPQMGHWTIYVLGAIQAVIILCFVFGLFKFFSYGLVMILHGISTIASYPTYFAPFETPFNLLFFAAWPMLAAAIMLFMLRKEDTFLALQ